MYSLNRENQTHVSMSHALPAVVVARTLVTARPKVDEYAATASDA